MEEWNQGDIDDLILDQSVKGMPGGIEPFRARRHRSARLERAAGGSAAAAGGAEGERARPQRQLDAPLPGGLGRGHRAARQDDDEPAALPSGRCADGAWAITVATAQQLQVARDFGFQRIVLANQLVGRQAIRYVLDELRRDPGFDFYCLVDSIENVRQLAEQAEAAGLDRPLQLLLEGGIRRRPHRLPNASRRRWRWRAPSAMRPAISRFAASKASRASPAAASPEESERQVAAFLDFLVEIAAACEARGLFAPGPIILSAGGSTYYDIVAERFRQREARPRQPRGDAQRLLPHP